MEYFKTLYINKLSVIELNAPIVLQETAIIKDTVENQILLRNTFVNVGNQNIVAILINIKLFNVFGEVIKDLPDKGVEYLYQDIYFEPNTLFGNKIAIELAPDARKTQIDIKKVVLEDGTVWKSNPNNIVTFQQQHEIEASDDFINGIDTGKIKPCFYYVENQSCWQCTCGQINKINEDQCINCNREKNFVKCNFTKEVIESKYKQYVDLKNIEREIAQNNLNESQPEEVKISSAALVPSKKKIAKSKLYVIAGGVVTTISFVIIICWNLFIKDSVNTKQMISQTTESLEPYVSQIGILAEEGNASVSDEFIQNLDNVYIMGNIGTVSHAYNVASGDYIAVMEWQSNETINDEDYTVFINSLNVFFDSEPSKGYYESITNEECLIWDDPIHNCWVVGWNDSGAAHLRWDSKEFN